MSNVINEGVKMCLKAKISNLFIVVRLLVELITSIATQEVYLEAYYSTR